jgi:DNA-binding PadR family transcriptional regulator
MIPLNESHLGAFSWTVSDNSRRAKFYELTKAGKRRLRKAAGEWKQTTEILARFLDSASKA